MGVEEMIGKEICVKRGKSWETWRCWRSESTKSLQGV